MAAVHQLYNSVAMLRGAHKRFRMVHLRAGSFQEENVSDAADPVTITITSLDLFLGKQS